MRSEILSKLIFAAVRGTPIARIAGRVSSLRREVGDSPWNYSVACTRVNRVMLVSLCAETKNPCLRGTKSDSCGRKCISYQVYPVTRITSEGRAEFLRAWGPGFEQEGAAGAGAGAGGATQSVRGNYNSFKGTNLTVVERMHQLIMYVL